MSVEINIDYSNINKQLDQAVEDALKELQPILEEYGQTHHRYNNRTGVLSNSTFAKQMKNLLTIGNNTDYAKFIHNGFKSWNPDPWLENTFKDNEELIQRTIDKHLNKAIYKINKGKG